MIAFVIAAVVVLIVFAVYLLRAQTPEQSGPRRPTDEERATVASTTPNDPGAEGMASPAPGQVGPASSPEDSPRR